MKGVQSASVNRIGIGLIRPTELVEMLRVVRMIGVNLAKIDSFSRDVNMSRELVQGILPLALNPHMQVVFAIGNISDVEDPLLISDRVERRGQRDNNCAHLRMNVAEDIRNAFARKHHAACRPCLVESKIETPSIEERKYIVKERICIRKRNTAADRNDQQMRREHFILLQQRKVAGFRISGTALRRLEPDDGWR